MKNGEFPAYLFDLFEGIHRQQPLGNPQPQHDWAIRTYLIAPPTCQKTKVNSIQFLHLSSIIGSPETSNQIVPTFLFSTTPKISSVYATVKPVSLQNTFPITPVSGLFQ